MNKPINGFPPGYGRKEPEVDDETIIKNKKQGETFDQLKNSITGFEIRGEPLAFEDKVLQTETSSKANKRKRAPGQTIQRQAAPPQAQDLPVMDNSKAHPVIAKMLEKFAIKKIKKYELELESGDGTKFNFTMTFVSDEAACWALEEAHKKGITEGNITATAWFSLLVSCLSIVAINDEPVWKMFDIRLTDADVDQLNVDQLNPTSRVRVGYATQMSKLMWSEMMPFADKLHNFYEDVIVPENTVTSSHELKKLNQERYVCPIDDCSVVEFLEPLLNDKNEEVPYYCKVHGKPLIKSLGGNLDNPL